MNDMSAAVGLREGRHLLLHFSCTAAFYSNARGNIILRVPRGKQKQADKKFLLRLFTLFCNFLCNTAIDNVSESCQTNKFFMISTC